MRKEFFIMEAYLPTIIWAVVFVASIWIEAETAEMISIWFMPGAVVALVLSLFDIAVWIQCVVFMAMSVVLLVVARVLLKKYIVKKVGQEKTDTDLLIGRQVKVEEDIDNASEKGAVRVNGQIWSARMTNDGDSASAGEFVIVDSISGVKLICRRI